MIPGQRPPEADGAGDDGLGNGLGHAALFGVGGIGRARCQKVGPLLSLVGDKWTVLVVMLLAGGPRRFNELKRLVGGISQRMLTFTLRALERNGLVRRTAFPTIPPRVQYELTPLGHSLREPLEALGRWVFTHQELIEDARRHFEKAETGDGREAS